MKNVPPKLSYTSRLHALANLVISATIRLVVFYNTHLLLNSTNLFPSPAVTPVESLTWTQIIVLRAILITYTIVITPLCLDVFNIVQLAIAGASPSQCALATNNFSSFRSLGTFWGSTWHQALRRITTRPFHLLLRRVGVRPGSLLYLFLHTIASFVLSGLAHMWMMLVLDTSGWRVFTFFVLQGLGVFIEVILHLFSPWSGPLWFKRGWALTYATLTGAFMLKDAYVVPPASAVLQGG